MLIDYLFVFIFSLPTFEEYGYSTISVLKTKDKRKKSLPMNCDHVVFNCFF